MASEKGCRERAAERRIKALELRQAGHSFRAIGKVLGVAGMTACKDVKRALDELSKIELKEAEHLRGMELRRYDRLLQIYWPKALAGDQKAAEFCVKIVEERREMLGLDAPIRHEVSGPGGGAIHMTTEERRARIFELLGRTGIASIAGGGRSLPAPATDGSRENGTRNGPIEIPPGDVASS